MRVDLAEPPEKNPDASALVCDDTTTSHSALGNSARFADYLTEGGLQRATGCDVGYGCFSGNSGATKIRAELARREQSKFTLAGYCAQTPR